LCCGANKPDCAGGETIPKGNATIASTPVARVPIAPAELRELTTHAVVLTACEAV
jgi:hypothetical protein